MCVCKYPYVKYDKTFYNGLKTIKLFFFFFYELNMIYEK